MRFPSFPTPPRSSSTTSTTRHGLAVRRRRLRRLRLIGATGAAAVAVVACTGFVGASVAGTALPGATALGLPTPSATAARDFTVTKESGDRLSVHADSAVPRATADALARVALSSGRHVAAEAEGKVATGALTTRLASLADYRTLNPDTVVTLAASTQTVAASVDTATTAADRRLAAASAAAAKKAAAARAAAQAAADAARQAAENTPAAAQATAKALMASEYGWGGDQFTCLVSLWNKESGWNYRAYNPSGASGIPQALPGSKMSSVAADWSTNATTQVIWGLRYIAGSYGTPCAAWSHSEAVNWY